MRSNILLEKVVYLLFFAVVALLPVQLGKHFWPSFSFVLGLRVDYLSPTIYLSDIFLFLFIITSLFYYGFVSKRKQYSKTIGFLLAFFILVVILSTVFNGARALFIFKTVKLLEFIFFAFFMMFMDFKKLFRPTLFILAAGIVWTSFLAIFQFANQHSLGLWFLGERNFNILTPGIARFVYENQLFLRPYATFPHPNLFAAWLALFLPWILFLLFTRQKTVLFYFFLASFLLGVLALFLSFSRTAWMAGFGAIFSTAAFLLGQRKQLFVSRFVFKVFFSLSFIVVTLGLSFALGSLVLARFLTITDSDAHSLVLRTKLAKAAIMMFLQAPIFGQGPANFIPQLPYFWQLGETIRILQPAHNLFLLVLAEIGLFGALTLISLFVCTAIWLLRWRLKDKEMVFLFVLSFSVMIFLSLFDHYFWTLQQGLLIFWFVLGWSWSFCCCKEGRRKS